MSDRQLLIICHINVKKVIDSCDNPFEPSGEHVICDVALVFE